MNLAHVLSARYIMFSEILCFHVTPLQYEHERTRNLSPLHAGVGRLHDSAPYGFNLNECPCKPHCESVCNLRCKSHCASAWRSGQVSCRYIADRACVKPQQKEESEEESKSVQKPGQAHGGNPADIARGFGSRAPGPLTEPFRTAGTDAAETQRGKSAPVPAGGWKDHGAERAARILVGDGPDPHRRGTVARPEPAASSPPSSAPTSGNASRASGRRFGPPRLEKTRGGLGVSKAAGAAAGTAQRASSWRSPASRRQRRPPPREGSTALQLEVESHRQVKKNVIYVRIKTYM
jgi:hypothetical protein